MAITYDTLGSTVTVYPTGTVAPGQLNTEVAIVGGYDSSNADSSVDPGDSTTVNTGTEADTMFGSTSELAYQTRLAFANGATAVHGVPVEETEKTETFGASTSTSSGTLSNGPVLDPNVNPDEEITAQDVTAGNTVDVNIVYEDSVSSPSESDTINLNPTSREWAADASSEYDITYVAADYESAIDNAIGEDARAVAVCSEEASVKQDLDDRLGTAEQNIRFMRGVTGADVDIDETSTADYDPDVEDWRMVEVAPPRGTSDEGDVRSVGAIAGMIASQPIDVTGSITYDTVNGLNSLRTEFSPTQAEDFEQVTAITDEFEIADGVTTAVEESFSDIYKVEIIDFIVEGLYTRIKDYRGGSNAQPSQRRFKSRLKRYLGSQSSPDATPPLLATTDGSRPYSVTVGTGAVDTETVLTIGIDPAPIAKEVTLDLSVGPIQFNGATV